jgi:hypothetical protein
VDVFRERTGYGQNMPSIKDEFERTADVTRVVLEGGVRALGRIPGVHRRIYETRIRMATDLQLTVANAVRLEPIRSVAATCASMTRDIAATQLSTARWFLDV